MHLLAAATLIGTLVVLQTHAARVRIMPRILLQLLILGTCVLCLGSLNSAGYTQSMIDRYEHAYHQMVETIGHDFSADPVSVSLTAKDQMVVSMVCTPREGATQTELDAGPQDFMLTTPSPYAAWGRHKAGMVIGVAAWAATLLFGWLFAQAVPRGRPAQCAPPESNRDIS